MALFDQLILGAHAALLTLSQVVYAHRWALDASVDVWKVP